jgi:hypothetical protein
MVENSYYLRMADARAMNHPTDKVYVVIKPVDKPDKYKGSWKAGQIIRINPEDYRHYIAGGIISPLDSAINQGYYDPVSRKVNEVPIIPVLNPTPKETIKEEPKPTPKTDNKPATSTTSTPTESESPKVVIGNSLKDAVQAKKSEIATKTAPETEEKTTTPKVNADKLAAIKAGGKK